MERKLKRIKEKKIRWLGKQKWLELWKKKNHTKNFELGGLNVASLKRSRGVKKKLLKFNYFITVSLTK